MDTLQLESFSYRWLVSITDDSTASAAAAASFIDIDPRVLSLRWTGGDAQDNFDFGNPIAGLPTLAHADEIFSGGRVLPLELVAASDKDDCDRFLSPDSVLSRSVSLDSTRVLLSLSKRYVLPSPASETTPRPAASKKSWLGSSASKKILRKYLCFLMPLLKKVKLMRTAAAAGKRGSKAGLDRCRRPSRAAVAEVVDEGLEKSIHEAVLHCKKSIGA